MPNCEPERQAYDATRDRSTTATIEPRAGIGRPLFAARRGLLQAACQLPQTVERKGFRPTFTMTYTCAEMEQECTEMEHMCSKVEQMHKMLCVPEWNTNPSRRPRQYSEGNAPTLAG